MSVNGVALKERESFTTCEHLPRTEKGPERKKRNEKSRNRTNSMRLTIYSSDVHFSRDFKIFFLSLPLDWFINKTRFSWLPQYLFVLFRCAALSSFNDVIKTLFHSWWSTSFDDKMLRDLDAWDKTLFNTKSWLNGMRRKAMK